MLHTPPMASGIFLCFFQDHTHSSSNHNSTQRQYREEKRTRRWNASPAAQHVLRKCLPQLTHMFGLLVHMFTKGGQTTLSVCRSRVPGTVKHRSQWCGIIIKNVRCLFILRILYF